ncbi:MAG: metallophosphoesterase [Alphaproteobacteria bacterium]|nr:metallophosphoesterase [Alphaproteobacteria bacterium]MBU0798212.1 metallophosphoesterase [Alphaproteobacteria bacterium]MBU0888642.1 metallophosphoesterase [Alphaproteobacteria bacterium]MBU1813624.1 metallophosphoesterase [Alphaproteobacteria bacterium]MBU2091153.1 metallophosphoesterase [Alphaproteobacteria bacterium]
MGEASAPPDTRLYAIGDVHGRADLLSELLELLKRDAARAPESRRVLVMLGDYIDRGEWPRHTVDMLLEDPLPGAELVLLCGNHEDYLIRFLDDPSVGPHWLANGGDATLRSYGIEPGRHLRMADGWRRMSLLLGEALTPAHRDFYAGLKTHHIEGDYLFVHAGIRPGAPLDGQSREEMLWIRDLFLSSTADHGAVVVHGHTVSWAPEDRPNRIGIDTGAFMTGRLTAAILTGTERRFIAT